MDGLEKRVSYKQEEQLTRRTSFVHVMFSRARGSCHTSRTLCCLCLPRGWGRRGGSSYSRPNIPLCKAGVVCSAYVGCERRDEGRKQQKFWMLWVFLLGDLCQCGRFSEQLHSILRLKSLQAILQAAEVTVSLNEKQISKEA